jgi:hypothetical protein
VENGILFTTQAFDNVWHTGLLYKLGRSLLLNYFLILKSYLYSRHFFVKAETECIEFSPVTADVPQGKVKVKVILRPTVSWPVRLDVRHPSGTRGQFFFLLEIFFRQLRVCYFVAPSLTRGRVFNLMLLLVLASTVPLGYESRGTQDHILLSQLLSLPQPGGPGPRMYIPQEQGGPDIPPGTGFPFSLPLQLAGLR